MHFRIEKQVFLNGIQRVQRGVALSTNMPILTGIYMQASQNKLELRATDLDMGIESTLPADINEEGAVVLPAKYVGEIVRRFSPGTIEIKTIGGGNTVEITSGRASFQLLGFPPADYPERTELAEGNGWQLPQEDFKEMIRKTVFAAAHDNLRPVLTGVLLSFTGEKLEMVATDSHRLAFFQGKVEEGRDKKTNMVVPRRALEEVLRLLGDGVDNVKIETDGGQACFQIGETTLTTRLIEGKFLDYRQVLPGDYKTRIQLDTGDFLAGIERAAVLSQDKANSVRLEVLDDCLQIFANTPEVGQVEEEIPAGVDGENINIAFNSRYLIEVLRVIDTEAVFFDITGSASPGIIRPVDQEEYLHLVMPVTTRATA